MHNFKREDIISTDKYLGLSSDKIFYAKTDILKRNMVNLVWRGKIHNVRAAPIWISGHSDYSIDKNTYDKYKQNCEHWFTVNKECLENNLRSLPGGITNERTESGEPTVFGNIDVMLEVMAKPRGFTNLVYMNFNINTYKHERQKCYDFFIEKKWVTKGENAQTLEGRRKFLEEIRNHEYVLCPRGNGLDTHRLWEALYMGSIPIVIKHESVNEFCDLPILFVDKWEEVTEDFLNANRDLFRMKKWNIEKLKFSYWENLIRNIEKKYIK